MKPMNLTEQQKRDWIDALRSGLYRQTRGMYKTLRSGEAGFNFCCLGVLCELNGIDARNDLSKRVVFLNRALGHHYNKGDSYIGYLIALNDVEKKTFAQIADEIEKMPTAPAAGELIL